MKLTPQQIEAVDAALHAADAEYLEVYHHYKKKYDEHEEEEDDGGHYQYFLDMKNECKAYGRIAVHLLKEGDILGAISEIWAAHACEGDMCGWVDFRVYGTPYKLLVDDIIFKQLGYLYQKPIKKSGNFISADGLEISDFETENK